ncbi:hypothetical protein [Pandoravirus japonicus]|uniref:Uncharacterized protein n=1 Tax=Pandoravirus japonicus TaxID=2823154 RepID=A0A811BNA8_9VIRU|nr:hypothetical protein [Pandoravirus japonicus]
MRADGWAVRVLLRSLPCLMRAPFRGSADDAVVPRAQGAPRAFVAAAAAAAGGSFFSFFPALDFFFSFFLKLYFLSSLFFLPISFVVWRRAAGVVFGFSLSLSLT